MELSTNGLKDPSLWLDTGYHVFTYDRKALKAKTLQDPQWIHFGAGNIFRAFPAHLAQRLIEKKRLSTGILVAEGFDLEILDKAYAPYDDLSILATLKCDGSIDKTVIGSVVKHLRLKRDEEDYQVLKQIFRHPSLQMATFTITEKGYQLYDANQLPYPDIQKDFALGYEKAESYIGKITALLYERYLHGAYPIAMLSLDNCSHNGDKLADAMKAFALCWSEQKFVEKGFYAYLCDEQKVTFPCSMIDKITPRPSDIVIDILHKDGIADIDPTKTSKGTFVAPFVNAEEKEYLVIEDKFPNGRPPLEEVGVMFCEKAVVEQVERMKVCTCLNPLHTTMAIFGCLFHHATIYDCMQDPSLRHLVENIAYQEGLPVVNDPKIIQPKTFLDEVLNTRFVNPFLPDTPQRIATDTSLKLGIRFGETIKAYMESKTLDVQSLTYIPIVFAGWCRYLMGIDDAGNTMPLSDDPALAWACEHVKNISLGYQGDVHAYLYPILSNQQIFQVDLYANGLAMRVETIFEAMIKEPGAVKSTIRQYL